MFKADIKLPIIIPIVAISIAIAFSFLRFTPMTVIIYLGSLYLVIYYISGYLRRRDALILDNDRIYIKTPFRYREWDINQIQKVFLIDGNTQLKADIIDGDDIKTITLCNAIYTKSIEDIYTVIIHRNPELK